MSDGSPGSPTHPNGNLTDWVNYTYRIYDPITPPITSRKRKMLVRVDYPHSSADVTDATHAHYDYRTDNVHEDLTTQKRYPLLQRCDDVRYNGPMRTIRYEYQNHYPAWLHLERRNLPAVARFRQSALLAQTPLPRRAAMAQTGQGPTRTFTYTHMLRCTRQSRVHNLLGLRDSNPPQQMSGSLH